MFLEGSFDTALSAVISVNLFFIKIPRLIREAYIPCESAGLCKARDGFY
jgi:hypothetical protein